MLKKVKFKKRNLAMSIYTSITDQLPGDVSLLLTNAIWFKDSWNQPFDPVFER